MPPVQQSMPPQGRPMNFAGPNWGGGLQNGTGQVNNKKFKVGNLTDLIKTIAIIALSLIAVTFIGLFIWSSAEYGNIEDEVQSKIDAAVAKAKDEVSARKEAEFLEREKNPSKTFSGPADYGQLTFQYPKTWSVYVADPATNGGDFTVNALRVSIINKAFDVVAADYQKAMNKKDSNLKVESVTVNGITANRYTGTIPGTELSGYIIIFKIRDKTAIVQTDSVLFADDYNKLIETITFNA